MKYLPLIWAGLWRKKLRTMFTFLSILAAFVLFGVLQGVDAGLAHIRDLQRLDRLYAVSRFNTPLPISNGARIGTVPGVTLVAPAQGMGGYWRDQKNGLGIVSVDERMFAAFPEITVTKGQLTELSRTRTGALISVACAEKYGWKTGDKISVTTTLAQRDGSKIWTFDVLGVFSRDGHDEERYIISNYAYLDEARVDDKGTVNYYVVRIADPAQSTEISRAIDTLFATSGAPTRTFSEKASGQSAQNSNFNMAFFTKAVVGAAFFTLLFLTANTMMQAFRERIPEFAVLKTLGFSDLKVFAMVLAESTLLTVTGAVLGLAIAALLMPLAKDTIGIAHIRAVVFIHGALVALLVAFVSGMVPGWSAKRLSVVDALAGR
jgi:putative ABC transport system permease protein